MVVFEDLVPSTQRMKNSLIFALWFLGNSQFKCVGSECFRFFGCFGHYVGAGLGRFSFRWIIFLLWSLFIFTVCFRARPFFLYYMLLNGFYLYIYIFAFMPLKNALVAKT